MSEQVPLSVPPEIPPSADSGTRTGLTVAGILLILSGVASLMMAGFVCLGMFLARFGGGAVPVAGWREIVPSMVLFLGCGGLLIWVGIGSVQAQRWARALALTIAWVWFLCGLIGLLSCAAVLLYPGLLEGMLPPGVDLAAMKMILSVMMAINTVPFVLLPLGLLLFYRRQKVRDCCELYHPEPSWTDRCPLPVLAIPLAGALGVPFLLLMGLLGYPFPFFGWILAGPGALAAWGLLAVLWGYASWQFYRLEMSAWWLMQVLVVVPCLSSVVTNLVLGLRPYYQAMGLSEERIDLMLKSPFAAMPFQLAILVLSVLSWSGYLLWIRRYFVPRPPAA